jgi:Na+/H+-dicarboxylate symporter
MIASIIGLISILCFKGLFKTDITDSSTLARIQLGCDEPGSFLTHDIADGSVVCSANVTETQSSFFQVTDYDGTFVHVSAGTTELGLSDTIYEGVFGTLVTSNIFADFATANFASVVIFAIAMGAALAVSLFRKGKTADDSVFVAFLRETDAVFIILIHWIIMITPFAVFSMISSAVGSQDNLADSFSNVAYLCLGKVEKCLMM